MPVLYDAERCPFCARVRIVLGEKRLEYEVVAIDLDDRPAWLYAKNPTGKVPVLEEDEGLVLPESAVIMEYLEERFPEPPLLPADPAERALARLRIERFDDVGGEYYALRRGHEGAAERLGEQLGRLDAILDEQPFLTGRSYGLADIAYVPWILRAQVNFGVALDGFPSLEAWVRTLLEREPVARELELAGVR